MDLRIVHLSLLDRFSARVGSYHSISEREHHELGTCFELQLAHDVRPMASSFKTTAAATPTPSAVPV